MLHSSVQRHRLAVQTSHLFSASSPPHAALPIKLFHSHGWLWTSRKFSQVQLLHLQPPHCLFDYPFFFHSHLRFLHFRVYSVTFTMAQHIHLISASCWAHKRRSFGTAMSLARYVELRYFFLLPDATQDDNHRCGPPEYRACEYHASKPLLRLSLLPSTLTST